MFLTVFRHNNNYSRLIQNPVQRDSGTFSLSVRRWYSMQYLSHFHHIFHFLDLCSPLSLCRASSVSFMPSCSHGKCIGCIVPFHDVFKCNHHNKSIRSITRWTSLIAWSWWRRKPLWHVEHYWLLQLLVWWLVELWVRSRRHKRVCIVRGHVFHVWSRYRDQGWLNLLRILWRNCITWRSKSRLINCWASHCW